MSVSGVRFSALLSFFVTIAAEAHPFAIVSAAPPLRDHIAPPRGYITCYAVPPAFHGGIWINAHRVCEYNNRAHDDRMWVSGYWQCVRFRHMEGVCLSWNWMPGHWANPQVAEYGVHWRQEPYPQQYQHSGHYSFNQDTFYRSRGYQSSGSSWR